MTVDYLFYNMIVLTMADPVGCGIIPNSAMVVKGDRVAGVGESGELIRHYSAHRYIDGQGRLLTPGLVNAHVHTGISIYKGFAQDTKNWTSDCALPLKGAFSVESRRVGSMAIIAEAIKAGTITMVDSSKDVLLFADNHVQAGARAQLSHTVHGLPLGRAVIGDDELYPLEGDSEQEFLKSCRMLITEYYDSHSGRITCGLCSLGLDRVSRETLQIMKEMSDKEGFPIHLRPACGERKVKQMQMRCGKRSISFPHELGLVDRRLIAVRLSVANEDEIRFLAGRGAGMVLCPRSKAIVNGNVPPAFELSRCNPHLAIGSDQTSGDNPSNPSYEMKIGALLDKYRFKGPSLSRTWKMLRLATIDGARAMGMDRVIGPLELGKKADMIMLNLEVPQVTPSVWDPMSNLIPNLIYATNGSEVQLSMVDGRTIMEDRILLSIDEKKIIREAQQEGRKFLERADHKPLEKDGMIQKLKKENKL